MSQHSPLIAPSGTLERELLDVLRSASLDERQSAAVAGRLGWDGRGATTLQQAALSTGYTRERVRQLEASFRERATRDRQLPLLERAIAVVEASAPDARSHVALTLQERGVSGAPFEPSGVLTAAMFFNLPTIASVRGGFVESSAARNPARSLVSSARRLVAARGAISVVEVARASGVEPARARRLLDECPDVVWLDQDCSWLGLRVPNTRRRLDGILRKMLAVSRSLTLAEAGDGLRRSYRPVVLPSPVLRRLFETVSWLQIDDRRGTIKSELEFDRGRELSPVEERLIDLFVEHGPTLAFAQTVKLGATLGLNKNTVGYYLAHAPIIKSVRPGRYSLRGLGAYEVAA
jgi:hypothetical protein